GRGRGVCRGGRGRGAGGRGGGGRGRRGRGRGGAGGGRRRGARRRGGRTDTAVDHLSLAVDECEARRAVRGAVIDTVFYDVIVRIVPVRLVGDDARLAGAHVWPVRRRIHQGDGARRSWTSGEPAPDRFVPQLPPLY